MIQKQEITGIFLGATEKKLLENGKCVRDFYLDITTRNSPTGRAEPNTPCFGLYGDKCNLVDNLEKNQLIKVTFFIRGKKYTNRTTGKAAVFTGLSAWNIEPVEQTVSDPIQTDSNGDDLPF